MAVDSTPLLKRRMTLLAKTETTTGTAITLAAANGAFNVWNPVYTPDIQIEQRPAQAGFGQLPAADGTRFATLEFDVDVAGAGASGAPLWASTLLTACGFNASGGTYTVGYNAAQPTVTLGLYSDGFFESIAGAAGSVTFPLRAGFPCRAHFRFMGKIIAPSDVALVTPTAFTSQGPRFANDALTFGAFTPKVSQMEIQVNNTLTMREDPADLTGARSCVITDRQLVVTADPEASLVSGRDWYTLITAHTEETMSVALGTLANNTMTFTSTSKMQWTSAPAGDRNGLITKQVTGQLNSDTLVLTFS